MTLKIKDKKNIWTKLYFRSFYNEKIWITWGLIVDKGSRIRIRVTQKDRIRFLGIQNVEIQISFFFKSDFYYAYNNLVPIAWNLSLGTLLYSTT